MTKRQMVSPSSIIDTLAKSKIPSVGIDLGGTKIRAALVHDNHLVTVPKQVATPDDPGKILDVMNDLFLEFSQTAKENYDCAVAGIGIATAGIIDGVTGEVLGSTGNLPGWAGTKVKQVFESRTLLPVFVENDANAAAYAEARTDEMKGKKCIVAITLGTGVGGGIIIDDRVFHGSHYAAGEIGHIKISLQNERLCTCGLFDCWESFASGQGLIKTANSMLDGIRHDQSPLAQSPASLSTHAIFASAEEGDLLASKIVAKWHEHVAIGIISLSHVLSPDCFILGGGLSQKIDANLLTEIVKDKTLPAISKHINITISKLGIDAGLIGAGQLALDEMFGKAR